MLQYVLYLDLYLAPTFGDSSTSPIENIKNKDTMYIQVSKSFCCKKKLCLRDLFLDP